MPTFAVSKGTETELATATPFTPRVMMTLAEIKAKAEEMFYNLIEKGDAIDTDEWSVDWDDDNRCDVNGGGCICLDIEVEGIKFHAEIDYTACINGSELESDPVLVADEDDEIIIELDGIRIIDRLEELAEAVCEDERDAAAWDETVNGLMYWGRI